MDYVDSFLFKANRSKLKKIFDTHTRTGELTMNELF